MEAQTMRPISWQRFIAGSVLLCWIYFSTAAPFVHTCRLLIWHEDVPSLNCATVCVSCQWISTSKSTQITFPPSVPLPLTVIRALPAPPTFLGTPAPILLLVRAPPA
jgi:hypothetical protein